MATLGSIVFDFTRTTQVEEMVVSKYRITEPAGSLVRHLNDPDITIIHKWNGMYIGELGACDLPTGNHELLYQLCEAVKNVGPEGYITLFASDKSMYDEYSLNPELQKQAQWYINMHASHEDKPSSAPKENPDEKHSLQKQKEIYSHHLPLLLFLVAAGGVAYYLMNKKKSGKK